MSKSATPEKIPKHIELISGISIHGIPKLVDSRPWTIRIIWLLLIIGSAAYCIFNVNKTVQDYYAFEVITNIETVPATVVPFPTVKFCSFDLKQFSYKSDCKFNGQSCSLENLIVTPDSCVAFNTGLTQEFYSTTVFNSTQSGYHFGLTLNLYNKGTRSIKFKIYHQTKEPSFKEFMFAPASGETDYMISRELKNKLSDPYSQCQRDYSFSTIGEYDKLNASNVPYFQSNCFITCRMFKEMEFCNKSQKFEEIFQYYYTNNVYFHSIYEDVKWECWSENRDLANDFDKNFEKKGVNEICKDLCPIECNSVEYDVSSFFIKSGLNRTVMNVYYKDLNYKLITEIPKTNLDSMIGTVGGLLGLFLGISYVSVFEILEIISHMVYSIIMYRSPKKVEEKLSDIDKKIPEDGTINVANNCDEKLSHYDNEITEDETTNVANNCEDFSVKS